MINHVFKARAESPAKEVTRPLPRGPSILMGEGIGRACGPEASQLGKDKDTAAVLLTH